MSLAAFLIGTALLQVPKPRFEEISPGSGLTVEMGDVVQLGFRCTYLNGQILDSTFGKAPLAIKLGWRPRLDSFARIPFAAFDESLLGMKSGGKRRVTLPSALAFGALEIGDVPPNTDLTFEVELYDVIKKGARPPINIQEIRVGTGEQIVGGSTATVHYRGTFLSGVEFETSIQQTDANGEPVGAGMSLVYQKQPMIKGFEDGLKGMKVGGIRRVTIPYHLAYGEKGSREIPPYTSLVFELRLMDVKKPTS